MDIFRFINSEAIRDHLKSVNYEFSSLEAAWLIYQCHTATIEEKHRAWKELIETMPDCQIAGRGYGYEDNMESLHDFLRQYMELEDKYVNEFQEDHHCDSYRGPYVYRIEHHYSLSDLNDRWDFNTVFSQYAAVFEYVLEPDDEVLYTKIVRMKIDDLHATMTAKLTPNLDILEIDPGEIPDSERRIWGQFDLWWFEFPTPFKKGDIVWNPNRPIGICGGAFALISVCPEGIKDEKLHNYLRENGDYTDMFACGYFQNEDGSLYQEVMFNYMDLEYYDKELTGVQRTLITMSNYLKGHIDVELLMRAYHQIITQGHANDSMPRDMTEKEMVLAGLKDSCEGLNDVQRRAAREAERIMERYPKAMRILGGDESAQ